MKKLILPALFVFLIFSCKKNEDPQPEPEPTPVAPPKKQATMLIDGVEFSCTTCVNTYGSSGLYGINIAESSTNRMVFSFGSAIRTGTFELSKTSSPMFTYQKDGYYYKGIGVLNVTAIDTAGGTIKKFEGVFNCLTDTLNNKSFQFKNGVISLDFK